MKVIIFFRHPTKKQLCWCGRWSSIYHLQVCWVLKSKTPMWTKITDSFSISPLWLLSDNHLLFPAIPFFCQFTVFLPICMGDCRSAPTRRASQPLHHTCVLNLSSGVDAVSPDALQAFSRSSARIFAEERESLSFHSVSHRRRVVTAQEGDWRDRLWGNVGVIQGDMVTVH